METSVMKAHRPLSKLSLDEVEWRISKVPGIESGMVNFAEENATACCNKTWLDIAQ